LLALVLAGVCSLAFTANALAALSGTAIKVATPLAVSAVSVRVDSAGTSYIAWGNTEDAPPSTTDVVGYCVLPAGASACAHAGTLTPAGGAAHIDNVQVLLDGTVVVILADVSGATSNDYVPEQEWQSTNGGASFTGVESGKSVADGEINSGTAPLNAVIVPGTDALGYGWTTAGSEPPTFDEFPLTDPPECSVMTCPPDEAFASLAPSSQADQIGTAPGQFASELGPDPGVLGFFSTDFSSGNLSCPMAPSDTNFGTAFVYGSGLQSPTNSYDISPGQPDSAWRVPVTQYVCDFAATAVAGGPSGLGVVEVPNPHRPLFDVYRRFDQSAMKFDTSFVQIPGEDGIAAALAQDGAGGVYVIFGSNRCCDDGTAITLSYSYDGGSTWSGPGVVYPDTDYDASDVTGSVGSSGQGWAAWFDAVNGSVYAQPFDAADSVPPPTSTTTTTTEIAGSRRGTSLRIRAGTVGESDEATITGADASDATGTVTYKLYSGDSCSAATAVFKSAPSAVFGGVAAPSDRMFSALSPGRYYWQAVYSGHPGSPVGTLGNLPSSSRCGSEVLTVSPFVAIAKRALVQGKTIAIKVRCGSPPCRLKLTFTRKARARTVPLATGRFTVRKAGSRTLRIHLSGPGRRYFRRHHGAVQATVKVSEHTAGGTVSQTQTAKIGRPNAVG